MNKFTDLHWKEQIDYYVSINDKGEAVATANDLVNENEVVQEEVDNYLRKLSVIL